MYLSTTGLWFTLCTFVFAQLNVADASLHSDITRSHSRRSFDIRNKQTRRDSGYERRLLGLDIDTPLGSECFLSFALWTLNCAWLRTVCGVANQLNPRLISGDSLHLLHDVTKMRTKGLYPISTLSYNSLA